jgi:serine acetyltransferase
MISEVFNRIAYWRTCDRIGPDIPWTHWRLHFPTKMQLLCKKKFRAFGVDAEFRPGAYAVVCSQISLGCRVVIRPHTMLHASPQQDGSITIEDDVMMGSGVHVYVSNHSFGDINTPIINQGFQPAKEVILRSGCWIGANAIILPGVEVGKNAVVGAGSVVTKSVPPRVVVAGCPARVLRKLELGAAKS